jgi:hypothetical protein
MNLAACSEGIEQRPRLVYEEDGGSNGSPEADPGDVVHMGFGYFRAVGGPLNIVSARVDTPSGFRPAGPGFLEVKGDNNLCEYSIGMNDYHPCPNVISLAEAPTLTPGHDAFLIVSVSDIGPGRHPIRSVRVVYGNGTSERSFIFGARDFVRGIRID